MALHDWLVFMAIWFAAGTPLGPNALNCIVVSASNGFQRSLWAVLGVALAALCHLAAMSVGLSTILLANATLFHAIKWFGVAYLAWMGVTMLTRQAALPNLPQGRPVSRLAATQRAFLISLTNPKAILVYLAVFPQFIKPTQDLAPQLAILVPSALVIVVLIYTGYCALGLGVRRLLSTLRRRRAFNRGVGGFYLFSALGLAWFDPRRS
jgi:homoserine/homoserine lactone efflux protein